MSLKLGELFAGYGGLGLAVEEVFGAELAWYAEYDAAPSKIMAHHWPDLTNYGDVTAVDWASVPPVDIISGGSPCQDLSLAGARRGMTAGTRSNLWEAMREAVATIKPAYVVWENVRGSLSAKATSASDLEPGAGLLGNGDDGHLRALGRVLGDLADLGYDCQWRGLRAADVGACHSRFRVFVLAANRDHLGNNGAGEWTKQDRRGQPAHSGHPAADSHDAGRGEHGRPVTVQPEHPATEHARAHAPDTESVGRGEGRPESAQLQRGPATTGHSAPVADTERLRGERRGIDGDLAGTPRTGETHRAERQRDGDAPHDSHPTDWGKYEPAIRRWERTIGRPAPRPTEPTGRNNGHRLSPKFTEWMMGLPEGWVTDPAIGISRNEQLKAYGNGVVPQHAMAALRDMLAAFNSQEATA